MTGLDRTIPRIAFDLRSGAPLVLQRVGRSTTSEEVAAALAAELGSPVRAASRLDDASGVAVIDGRSLRDTDFATWDLRRATLVPPGASRVVLLDAATASWLLQNAPHTASWAGGVSLPADPAVRAAQSDEELEAGAALFDRWLREGHGAALRGQVVALDLVSGRAFVGRVDASPLAVAQEQLDEGIVYVERVR